MGRLRVERGEGTMATTMTGERKEDDYDYRFARLTTRLRKGRCESRGTSGTRDEDKDIILRIESLVW